MSVDEDTELRDLLMQTLESNGVLSKVKAELRASVFLALEGDRDMKKNHFPHNKKLQSFLNTTEGRRTVSMVREFLEFFSLNFTLTVFDPEVCFSEDFLSRKELCSECDIPNADPDLPVICELVKSYQGGSQGRHKRANGTGDPENDFITTARGGTFEGCTNDFAKGFPEMSLKQGTVAHDPFYDAPVQEPHLNISTQFLKGITNGKNEEHGSTRNEKERLLLTNPKSRERLDPIRKAPDASIFAGEAVLGEGMNMFSRDSASQQYFDSKSMTSDYHLSNFNVNGLSDDASKGNILLGGNKSCDVPLRSSSNLDGYKETNAFSVKADSIRDNCLNTMKVMAEIPVKQKSATSKTCSITSVGKSSDGEESEKSDRSEKSVVSTGMKYAVESCENSEQSVEEEIEDDVSVGIDDLLSSISIGDDTTSDATLSQPSVVGGLDHVEDVLPK